MRNDAGQNGNQCVFSVKRLFILPHNAQLKPIHYRKNLQISSENLRNIIFFVKRLFILQHNAQLKPIHYWKNLQIFSENLKNLIFFVTLVLSVTNINFYGATDSYSSNTIPWDIQLKNSSFSPS